MLRALHITTAVKPQGHRRGELLQGTGQQLVATIEQVLGHRQGLRVLPQRVIDGDQVARRRRQDLARPSIARQAQRALTQSARVFQVEQVLVEAAQIAQRQDLRAAPRCATCMG